MVKELYFCIVTLSLCLATSVFAKDEYNYFPTPVPINITPGNYEGSSWGLGYNHMKLTSDWDEDFWTFKSENVGEIDYQVDNVVLAFLKSKRQSYSVEYDLLIGKITSKSKTDQYYSKLIGRDVDVDHSGDGFDIGFRVIYSKNLFRQLKEGNKRFIDWNYGLSLHVAYFHLRGTYEARSVDDLYANEYDSEEDGRFIRPVLMLQPIMDITDRISLIPYIGVGTKISLWYQYWEDVGDYIFNGNDSPSQKSDGEEWGVDYSGIETYLGFDVGFKVTKRSEHLLRIGGTFTKLFGEEDSDFAEVHVVYSIPFL
ncbi:MAG: hypothetical protein KJO26_00865 [Deltaproteobacteria bacterium]|nr:hypothetical protein [Deltaproteobacteria bacterium]